MGCHHLTDSELVMLLDGELSPRRQAAAHAHVTECTACRTRQTQLDERAQAAAALYLSAPPAGRSIAESRDTLRSKLAAVAQQQGDAPVARGVLPFLRPSEWAAAGVVLAAVILLAGVVQQYAVHVQLKTIALNEHDALPIASLTPGATWNLTLDEICSPAGRDEGEVPSAIRLEVLRAYRMEQVPAHDYELDYLITPELGGAPTAANLWPQRYASSAWNAHVKDELEQLLAKSVCGGMVPLRTAQREIAADWIAAYKKYFQTDVPRHAHSRDDHRPLELISFAAPEVWQP